MEDQAGERLYGCYKCQNHACRQWQSLSVMNVVVGPAEDKVFITGFHSTAADVHCCDCGEVMGWKYRRAYHKLQKYKDGKVVLEKLKIFKLNW